MGEPTQLNFVNRIQKPRDYPYLKNEDGSISTHRMAAEIGPDGNWYAFPTIIQTPEGALHKFKSNRLAMDYALRTGEVMPFNKDKASALKYAEGAYKKGTALESFNPMGRK